MQWHIYSRISTQSWYTSRIIYQNSMYQHMIHNQYSVWLETLIAVAHSGFNLGGSRIERIQILLMQIQSNSLDDYKNLFEE